MVVRVGEKGGNDALRIWRDRLAAPPPQAADLDGHARGVSIMRFTLLAAACLLIPTAASATATTFDWTFSGDFAAGSGTLTANEVGGQFVVSSISGSVSDSQPRNILGLLTPHQTYASISDIGGDNLIFPAPASPFLDSQGIVFSVGGVGSDPCPFQSGCYMNIYYNATLSQYELNLSNAGVTGGNFVLTAEATPSVPEPSTWAMMLFGFGAMGGALRARRRRASRFVAA